MSLPRTPRTMACRSTAARLGLLALLLAPGLPPALAQARDPMLPPPSLRPATPGAALPDRPALPDSAQVLIIDGKAYALIGSRRYAQGARVGAGPDAPVVERVNEHGVWLRSRDGLHALPMLSGVSKKPSPASASHDKSQEKRDRP